MAVKVPSAITIGENARRLNVPIHRIEYVARSRNLKASSIAGNARVFTDADVQFIQSELRRMADDRKACV